MVIAAGGGGIPVVEGPDKTITGIDAVVDKDLATAILAKDLGTEVFINLTQIDRAYLNFNKPGQKGIDRMTVKEAKKHLKAGEFLPGSMAPKIEAAIEFIEGRRRRGHNNLSRVFKRRSRRQCRHEDTQGLKKTLFSIQSYRCLFQKSVHETPPDCAGYKENTPDDKTRYPKRP